jgi:hypothetical protein
MPPNPGLAAFLTGLIDYAGLFPPAGLPLPEAAANYLRYSTGPDAWMLGRFVCPASQLATLDTLLPLSARCPLTVLATGGADAPSFLAALEADLTTAGAFRDLRPDAPIESLELRLPTALLAPFDAPALRRLFAETLPRIESAGLPLQGVFVEGISLEVDGVDRTVDLVHAVRPVHPGPTRLGFKLRTGGLKAADFPSVDVLAAGLVICRDAGLPFKATAGLHHPVRSFRAEVNAEMHGFLNVFGAGVLAHARGLDAPMLVDLLSDTDPTRFRLDDAGFAWAGYHATPAEIAAARAFATSFGSCSFEEPTAELFSTASS